MLSIAHKILNLMFFLMTSILLSACLQPKESQNSQIASTSVTDSSTEVMHHAKLESNNTFIVEETSPESSVVTADVMMDASYYKDQHEICPEVTQEKLNKCYQEGGMFRKQGRAQCYACVIEYADAGKICSSSSECMGNCYSKYPVREGTTNVTGKCSANNSSFGCRQEIENGIAKSGVLCVD